MSIRLASLITLQRGKRGETEEVAEREEHTAGRQEDRHDQANSWAGRQTVT